MNALHYTDWGKLEMAELDEPARFDGEVVVRVAACGICGSELETFANRSERRTPPLVMGHEFCGYVESGHAKGFPVGSPVVCNAIVHCGSCSNCLAGRTQLCVNRAVFGMHRPGAFAERVAAPSSCLLAWPDNMPASWACLAEPLGNGVHVAARIRHTNPGSVLVIGAGSIGLMVLQAVQTILGVPVSIVDIVPERLEAARALGAAFALASTPDSLEILKEDCTDGLGFDVVVDAAGTAATKSMSIELCRDEGLIVWIGLGSDDVRLKTYPITLREQTVTGSYGATADDMKDALQLMAGGRVDVASWVSTYALSHAVEAFLRQLDASRRDIKAVIRMDT